MKKIVKRIITSILVLIVFVLGYFVIANVVATNNNTIASFFGYSISYVPTNSMEPTIKTGSTVMFEQNSSYDDLKCGDIIVYYNNETNMYIIHRIKNVDTNGFIMQGDNNPREDYYSQSGEYYYVTKDNYVGKYVCTISAFSLSSTLSRTIVFILSVIIFIVIFASEAINIFKIIHNKDENKKEEIDKELLRKEVLEELKKELENKK